jgi:hypothetical protein
LDGQIENGGKNYSPGALPPLIGAGGFLTVMDKDALCLVVHARELTDKSMSQYVGSVTGSMLKRALGKDDGLFLGLLRQNNWLWLPAGYTLCLVPTFKPPAKESGAKPPQCLHLVWQPALNESMLRLSAGLDRVLEALSHRASKFPDEKSFADMEKVRQYLKSLQNLS